MLNRICMVGRVVKDPEIRKTATGVPCMNGTLAVDTFSKEKGKHAEFFKFRGYSSVAEIFEKYIKKGTLISISGQLYQSAYERRDGTRGEEVGIRVTDVDILSKFKKEDDAEAKEAPQEEAKAKDIVPEELPF